MSGLNDIRNILVTLLVLVLFGGGMFFWGTTQCETITPDPIIVEIPILTGKTDVVQLSSPRTVSVLGAPQKAKVDSTYYYKYLEQTREVDRLNLFIDAIKIDEKTITLVDDSIMKIDVTSKTRGELISQYAEYTVKPQRMTLNPEPYFVPKVKVFVGGIFSLPLETQLNVRPTLEANIMFERTGKEDMFIFGIDSDKFISVGYMFRIFKGKK